VVKVKPVYEDETVLARLRFVLPIRAGEMSINEAKKRYKRSRTAIKEFLGRYDKLGVEGLRNRPRGKSNPITPDIENEILLLKRERRGRSGRKIRDLLREKGIRYHRQTVWRVLLKHGENRRELKPLKPDKDFEYPEPNDAWQIDIMDGIIVKGIGLVYLHSCIDDHSRFLTGGRWFLDKTARSVLLTVKEAFETNGLPKHMIADQGTQFKRNLGPGMTQFEKVLKRLGVDLIFTSKGNAKSKGKKERFYRFVQEDFLQEFEFASLDDLNLKWRKWSGWYCEEHEHSGIGGASPASRYARVRKRFSPFPLEDVFATVVERRVRTNATVSFRRNVYIVDPKYIRQIVELRAFENHVRIFHRGVLLGTYDARINYRERMLRQIHMRRVCKDGTIRFRGKRYFVGTRFYRRRLELMKKGPEVHIFLSATKEKVFKVHRRYRYHRQG
jgi:transposase InsO family protein